MSKNSFKKNLSKIAPRELRTEGPIKNHILSKKLQMLEKNRVLFGKALISQVQLIREAMLAAIIIEVHQASKVSIDIAADELQKKSNELHRKIASKILGFALFIVCGLTCVIAFDPIVGPAYHVLAEYKGEATVRSIFQAVKQEYKSLPWFYWAVVFGVIALAFVLHWAIEHKICHTLFGDFTEKIGVITAYAELSQEIDTSPSKQSFTIDLIREYLRIQCPNTSESTRERAAEDLLVVLKQKCKTFTASLESQDSKRSPALPSEELSSKVLLHMVDYVTEGFSRQVDERTSELRKERN